MAGFVDKIKNTFNIAKIKSSEKQYSNLQPIFETNLERVKEATSSVNIRPYFRDAMTPVEAARYCVKTYTEGRPFYVLTCSNDANGKSTKLIKEVAGAVSAEFKAYLAAKGGANEQKAYYNAAAVVLSEINAAIGSNILVGFTCDSNSADNFKGFKYSINTSADDLNAAWSSVTTTTGRLEILYQVLGEKKKLVPNRVMGILSAHDKPFGTVYWKVVKHQTQYEDSIDDNILKIVENFSEVREVLQNGDNLKGLNFGKKTQFDAILMAITLGDEYMEQLHTANGWLDENVMEEKVKYLKEVMEQKNITSIMTPKMKQEVEEKKKLIQEKNEQYAAQKQQAELQKTQLEAQIAQMKAQISVLESQRDFETTFSNKMKFTSQITELKNQCKELESRCSDLERKYR